MTAATYGNRPRLDFSGGGIVWAEEDVTTLMI
jgi:hypothetical protein